MNKGFYIRKNNENLRHILDFLGYLVCKCAEFEDSLWLHVSVIQTVIGINREKQIGVHGVGYNDETYNKSQKEILKEFESTTKDIDCGSDDEMFLALAALMASEELTHTDYYCWFTNGSNFVQIVDKRRTQLLVDDIVKKAGYHKASEEEIINYFTNKKQ